jgi:ATPase subunit of ABC transporter with duplicated ATPase domains
MQTLLQNVGQLYANSLFLGNLFEFLALEPRVVDPPHPSPFPNTLSKGIDFDQVAFRYPGSRQLALEGFDLTIPAGQLVALVGPNGAGKGTMVKLRRAVRRPGAFTSDIPLRQRVGARRAETQDGVLRMQRPGLDQDHRRLAREGQAAPARGLPSLGRRFRDHELILGR